MSRFTLSRALVTLSLVGAMIMPISFASAQITAQSSGLNTAATAGGLGANPCGTDSGTACIANIIGRVINIALSFLGVILVVLFLYAGFMWMTAGGENEKVEKAQKLIANAIAGLVVVGIAFAVSSFVMNQLQFVLTGERPVTQTTTQR